MHCVTSTLAPARPIMVMTGSPLSCLYTGGRTPPLTDRNTREEVTEHAEQSRH